MFPCTCQLHNYKIKSPTIHEYNKTEFVSIKFQAFSSYSLICGENCALCRLSATVCFLSGMIVLLMGNSLNSVAITSFYFLCSNFLFIRKFVHFFVTFFVQAKKVNNKIRKKNINLYSYSNI